MSPSVVRSDRRGVALLAALVLLALSAALATATFSAAHAMRRAALTALAGARVETGVRRAFGEVLAAWSAALDTLPVGVVADVALGAESADAGPPIERHAHVERVAEGVYAVTVELRAFSRERPIARRRARLWLERPAAAASTPPDSASPRGPPARVTLWPLADLY